MAEDRRNKRLPATTTVAVSDTDNMSKAELQQRMEETRESISQTVEEIKETVTGQYETVKETVEGVLDYREQFQKDPLVWSVGALSAGFALGYTLGFAHKNASAAGHKHSQLAVFADSLVDELSVVGQSLVMPTLNSKIKELFGFDFSDLLEEIGHLKQSGPEPSSAKTHKTEKGVSKKSAQKSGAQKRGVKKGRAKKKSE